MRGSDNKTWVIFKHFPNIGIGPAQQDEKSQSQN